MLTRNAIAAALAVCASMLVMPANAVPIFDSSRTGIDDLDIGGTLYDVTFTLASPGVTGTTLFGFPNPAFTFTTASDAQAARAAIVVFLNANAGREELSTGAASVVQFYIPYAIANPPNNTIYQSAVGRGLNALQPIQWEDRPDQGVSRFQTHSLYWTTFELSPTTVPEPATLGLLGVGIVLLGFARRRRV